ncbi:uncharacterized protein CTRU02_201996 [Colletotrichum truncatum]|uniref:Uncharacterized protein n=1 Tax=Colletotrichum truncatum TaxID=5467 RepID=A0ACC3ZJ56_COLTU|nr:uncharacterized protein CTRU02_07114 [Colletotrichum truncatum]KAF6791929.1 hypothetical protein CTRU02_07114 [Colletotrichum truncatum]
MGEDKEVNCSDLLVATKLGGASAGLLHALTPEGSGRLEGDWRRVVGVLRRMHQNVQHYKPVPARSAWATKPHQGLSDHRVALTEDAIRQRREKGRADRSLLK